MTSISAAAVTHSPVALTQVNGKPLGPFMLGESPTWDADSGELWFVDIEGRSLHGVVFDADADVVLHARAHRSFEFERKVCAIGLTRSRRLLLALADGVYFFTPDLGTLELLAKPESDKPFNRLNDGKVGPDGAFWVGSMDERPERQPIGSLYRIAPDGYVRKMSAGYAVSNGLAWSPDGRSMYHSDSRGPTIDRWQFDPTSGRLGERTPFKTLTESDGRPDGGACDVTGCYWSAGVSAGVLNRFAPDGALVQKIELPVPAPTMPCFCGPDMKTIAVTSHRQRQDAAMLERHPASGHLVLLRTEVAGAPVARFADA